MAEVAPRSLAPGDGARGNPLAGPLGRRLLAWFLLFSLVPLLGSNTVGYLRSERLIRNLVERYMEAVAQVEAKHVRSEVERNRLNVQALGAGNQFLAAAARLSAGADPGIMGEAVSEEAVAGYLERKRRELVVFDALALQDLRGNVLAVAGDLPGGGLPTWSRMEPSGFAALEEPGDGTGPRFRITGRVTDMEGATSAYVTGVLGPEGVRSFLEIPDPLAGRVRSFIVDPHGHAIVAAAEPGAPGGTGTREGAGPRGAVDGVIASPALDQEPGTFARYLNAGGTEVIATTAEVAGLPWRYMAELPVSEALGPLRQLRRLSLLLGLIFTSLLLVTAWFVAGGIVAPVRRLVAATRRVAKGDLDTRVEVGEDDEIGALGAAFNDMTRELAEASGRVEAMHRREIERAHQLATVGELASGVAHEIKNPVVGISNGLDLVRRRVGPGDGSLGEIMEEMDRQLLRIEDAVRDLLAFARPATPRLAPADPARVAGRAARLVRPAAETANVALEIRTPHDLPPVAMDEEMIRQALVTLMMNAVQATPEGGQVSVSLGCDGTDLRIRVHDTGRGIAEDAFEDIFKPFFTTRHSGTGLGLSITREIAERHGGRVEVRSRVGRGASFTLVLPVAGRATDASDPDTPTALPATGAAVGVGEGERADPNRFGGA
jgi:signal transduction histidine kinase